MRALCLERNIPKVVLTKALGLLSKRAFVGGPSPLGLVDLPEPTLPNDRAVRVRNRLAGICGSDLALVFLEIDLAVLPALLPARASMCLGHEVVGVVEEVGAAVEGLAPGDRVVLRQDPCTCGPAGRARCPACAEGRYNHCRDLDAGEGFPMVGGGWAEGMVVAAEQLQTVPAALSDEAAVFVEPAACALRAVHRAQVPAGGLVVVLGAGTVGILCVRLLRILHPASTVFALARYPFQLERAEASGARAFRDVRELAQALSDAAGARLVWKPTGWTLLGGGADRVLDCVGTGSTVEAALRMTRRAGRVVLVGVHLKPMRFDATPVWFREVDLVGTGWHGAEAVGETPVPTFDRVIDLMAEGRLEAADLLTHRYALADYRRALLEAANKAPLGYGKGAFDLAC